MAVTPDAVIRMWFDELWTSGKEDTIDRLFAADGVAHGLPGGGVIAGPGGFRPFFRTFRAAFPDIQVEILRTVTEGDLVAAHCRVTATHKGADLGVAATGKQVEFSGMTISRIRNGQIAESWNSFDFMTLYQQIGMLPQL